MKNYAHIIWDWNGTLLDDAWLCLECINDVLERYGLPGVTRERYQHIFDFPVRTYYDRLGFDFSAYTFEQVATEFIVAYHQRRFECSLQQGAEQMLRLIHEQGATQSILSAYPHRQLAQSIAHYEIGRYFVSHAGLPDHYAAGKTEIGARHLAEIGVPAESVLMIGDTAHDAEVCDTLGIDCALIPSGHHPASRLRPLNKRLLDNLADIESLVSELPRTQHDASVSGRMLAQDDIGAEIPT
jgi:phosphoglycolate phosphatase